MSDDGIPMMDRRPPTPPTRQNQQKDTKKVDIEGFKALAAKVMAEPDPELSHEEVEKLFWRKIGAPSSVCRCRRGRGTCGLVCSHSLLSLPSPPQNNRPPAAGGALRGRHGRHPLPGADTHNTVSPSPPLPSAVKARFTIPTPLETNDRATPPGGT